MQALAVLLLTSQSVALSPGPHQEPIEPVQSGTREALPALPPLPETPVAPAPGMVPPEPVAPPLPVAGPGAVSPPPFAEGCSMTPVQDEISAAKPVARALLVHKPE